jgi:hypothetical protein
MTVVVEKTWVMLKSTVHVSYDRDPIMSTLSFSSSLRVDLGNFTGSSEQQIYCLSDGIRTAN